MRLLLLVILGCPGPKGDDGHRDTTETDDTATDTLPVGPQFVATVTEPEDGKIRLVKILEIDTAQSISLSIILGDDEGTNRRIAGEGAGAFAIPIVGLHAETDYTLDITATDIQTGGTTDMQVLFTTGSLPVPWPDLEVLAHDPARVSPGHTLFDVRSMLTDQVSLTILDEDLRPIWMHLAEWRDARMTADGLIVGILDDKVVEIDLTGQVYGLWAGEDLDPPVDKFHHEAYPTADGYWTLSWQATEVLELPVNYADVFNFQGPVTLSDPVVVRFDRAGVVQDNWGLASRLDTRRIGYDALSSGALGVDWGHANGLIPDPSDGGVIVSIRHQDCLVKLDASGDLVWILGNHEGWDPSFDAYLLTPVGDDFAWPFHQHAPALGPAGDLLVFDNGSVRQTPYGAPDPALYSRVVSFRVDAAAMTVEQLWEYRDTPSGDLYSYAVGDADYLENGNVLADFGLVFTEGGVSNADNGRAEWAARLIEFDPAQPQVPAFDIRFSAPAGHGTNGWRVYRAERIPSIYIDQAS